MILCDTSIIELINGGLIKEPNKESYPLVNPASLDIRVGETVLLESPLGEMEGWNLSVCDDNEMLLPPATFALVSTYENFTLPPNIAADLRLKSSIARMGFNHSLAFWVDPGWSGVLTMEIYNQRKIPLKLKYKMPFAQMIFHQLDRVAYKPYNGRYKNATHVEAMKIQR